MSGVFNSFRYNTRVYNAPAAGPIAAVVAGIFEQRSTSGTTGVLLAPTAGGSLAGLASVSGTLGVSRSILAAAGLSASARTAAGTLGAAGGTLAGGGVTTGNRVVAQLALQTAEVTSSGATATVILVAPAGSRGVPPAVVAAGGTVEPMRVTTGAT